LSAVTGTGDFLGLNQYSAQLIENCDRGVEKPGWDFDRDLNAHTDPAWPK